MRIKEGMIYIRGGRGYKARSLKLDASQVQPLQRCMRMHGKPVCDTEHAVAELSLPAGRSEQAAQSPQKAEP